MTDGLPIIIIDDDEAVCEVIARLVKTFYIWGGIYPFTDLQEALSFCKKQKAGVAIFILDVFLGNESGFDFLDSILDKFPLAQQDTIIITGNASNDIVNMCVKSDISYLLEKPIKPYALQLAVRAIVSKYMKFAKTLIQNTPLAERIARF